MKARVTVTLKNGVLDPQGKAIEGALKSLGYEQTNGQFFDTLRIKVDAAKSKQIRAAAEAAGYNFRYVGDTGIGISFDETVTLADLVAFLAGLR